MRSTSAELRAFHSARLFLCLAVPMWWLSELEMLGTVMRQQAHMMAPTELRKEWHGNCSIRVLTGTCKACARRRTFEGGVRRTGGSKTGGRVSGNAASR